RPSARQGAGETDGRGGSGLPHAAGAATDQEVAVSDQGAEGAVVHGAEATWRRRSGPEEMDDGNGGEKAGEIGGEGRRDRVAVATDPHRPEVDGEDVEGGLGGSRHHGP